MLTFVPTPIGNIQDITLRALRAIKESDVILCEDTRVTSFLLDQLKKQGFISDSRLSLMPLHSHNEQEFLERIEPSFFERNILYMSDAGMPCVSDPGYLLVRYAQSHQIPYTVLPGASALLTLYVASGGMGKEFLFFGFLPHKQQQRRKELGRLMGLGVDVIVYESPHRLLESLRDIRLICPAQRIFLAKEMTKYFEHYYFGNIQDILQQLESEVIRGEWAMVLYASPQNAQTQLSLQDLETLNIPPKIYAKILAKMQGKSTKECYNALLEKKSL